jgi:hypothetical protein
MKSFTRGIHNMSLQEVDQSPHVSHQTQSMSLDIVDRAKLYRRDLMLHSMKSSHVDDKRIIHVIFPCKSRQQLNVSTLYDLHLQIKTNEKTPVSYKITSTVNALGEEVHRLPAHRSTIYIHEITAMV